MNKTLWIPLKDALTGGSQLQQDDQVYATDLKWMGSPPLSLEDRASRKVRQEIWNEKCAGLPDCRIYFEVDQWRFEKTKTTRAATQTAKELRAGCAMTAGACAGALGAWSQNALVSRNRRNVSRNRDPGPHQTTDSELRDILALVNVDMSTPP